MKNAQKGGAPARACGPPPLPLIPPPALPALTSMMCMRALARAQPRLVPLPAVSAASIIVRAGEPPLRPVSIISIIARVRALI